jgi:succinoglycan biosynthesis protein ExoO
MNSPAPPLDDPRCSVVIAAFDAARHVERAVRSALEGQGLAVEVVAVDDASRDGTLAVLRRLAAADPRVRVIEGGVNRGPAAARNLGFAAARGDWIAVLDADDAFLPGRLARLVDRAEREGLDAIADLPVFFDLAAMTPAGRGPEADGGFETLDLTRFLAGAVDAGEGLDLGLLKPVVSRRLRDAGGWRYPEGVRHGEDFLLYFHALRGGARFGLLREALYLFSTRIGAASGAYSPGSVTRVDYPRIAADTRRLMAEVAGSADAAAILPVLERRLAKMADLNRRYGWTAFRRGAWRQLYGWIRQNPGNAALLARMGLEKLLGAVR